MMTLQPKKRRVERLWLLPLVPVYGAVLAAKGWLLERGWLRRRRLERPVISVGSLSAGGAGKTPVVLLLAEVLGQAGFAVRVLSRGYGRASTAVERVDPAGEAARFGDEPMLLARRLGPPAEVWVGADRYAGGDGGGRRRSSEGLRWMWCICSTMVFSTGSWSGISISCC